MSRVKGLAFRSVLVALESLEGADAVARVRTLLPADTAARLSVLAASTWYPVGDYSTLWATIQQATGHRKDLPRLIGRRAVENDLKFIHRLAFAALTVRTVLTIGARLFPSYYDPGTCRAVAIDRERVHVSFEGCIGFTEPMWTEVRGGIECFAELASKRRATSTIVRGGTDRATECVIEVHWTIDAGQEA